jgi:predicted phosphoadenosine phosphosulfate sulfurtransferase
MSPKELDFKHFHGLHTVSLPRWLPWQRYAKVSTIKRKLTEMVEACNPSYLVWWIEQGFSPLPVVQRQLEIFSEKIMPEFVG